MSLKIKLQMAYSFSESEKPNLWLEPLNVTTPLNSKGNKSQEKHHNLLSAVSIDLLYCELFLLRFFR